LVGEPGQGLLLLGFEFLLGAFGKDVGEESRQSLEVSEWVLTPQANECARDVVQFSFEDGLQELSCLPGNLVWRSFFSGHSSPLFITAQTYSVFAGPKSYTPHLREEEERESKVNPYPSQVLFEHVIGDCFAPDGGGNNITGFTALPAGRIDNLGNNNSQGASAWFWAAPPNPDDSRALRSMSSGNGGIFRDTDNSTQGFSVRCVKD